MFALFILLTLTLFVRPAELLPTLEALPLYNILILACLATCFLSVVRQLDPQALLRRPVTACVVGLIGAVVLSHLANLDTWSARTRALEFSKVVIYYLVLNSILSDLGRLRGYLAWLVILVTCSATLALLHYHEWIDLPALTALAEREFDESTGEFQIIHRLRATGIYNDPNDLSSILNVGILIGLYFAFDRGAGWIRFAWWGALPILAIGVLETKSRGGLLALLVGLGFLFLHRLGWLRTLILAGVGLPVVLALAGGRQAELSTSAGTAAERMDLWREGLTFLKGSPLFGIGAGNYAEEAGLVAHNSFLHCFGEMGLLGGGLFLGAFLSAGLVLWTIRREAGVREDADVGRLAGYLLAAVVSYAISLSSLSRSYVTPTYLILGLATAMHGIAVSRWGDDSWSERLTLGRLGTILVAASLVYPVLIYVFVKIA